MRLRMTSKKLEQSQDSLRRSSAGCNNNSDNSTTSSEVRRSFRNLFGRYERKSHRLNKSSALAEQCLSNSLPDSGSTFQKSGISINEDDAKLQSKNNRSFLGVEAARICKGLDSQISDTLQLSEHDDEMDHQTKLTVPLIDDMALELSMLEECLRTASMQPTNLLARDFPLSSTHGSSLRSMESGSATSFGFDASNNSDFSYGGCNAEAIIK
jgi:hypothetical protein